MTPRSFSLTTQGVGMSANDVLMGTDCKDFALARMEGEKPAAKTTVATRQDCLEAR